MSTVEQEPASSPATTREEETTAKKRSLPRIFLTLMVVYGILGFLAAYGFYYNHQEGGIGTMFLVLGLVTVVSTLLYILPYQISKHWQIILAIVIPYINLVLLEWFTHNPWETMSFGAFMLNLPFYYLFLLLFFFLTGSLRAALRIESIFSLMIGLANYFVILFRSTPILPWDLYSVGVASTVASNYTYSITWQVMYVLFAFVPLFLLESRITLEWKQRKIRLLSLIPWGVCAAAYLQVMWIPNLEDYFDIDNTLFTPGYMYRTNGFMTAFLMDTRYLSVPAPDGYTPEEARSLLADAAENEATGDTGSRPNVIVIMDEAFSDPAVLGDFETNTDYMPFIRSLMNGAENTISGYMYSSVLGGNTANTEFEFLTGHSMAFLPVGSVPYQQYLFDTAEGFTSHLNDLGYYSVGMHPYNSTGWNRNKVYNYFGFADMHFIADFSGGERLRKYISDACHFDKIISLYEKKDADTPLFSFNVTMQNHSGYSSDYNNGMDVRVTAGNINSSYLNNYLSLLSYTDEAFADLIAYFSEAEEDTIILLFGDHQPNDYVVQGIYKENGVNYESLPFAEQQNRYQVPFLIWANFDIEEQTGVYTSANYLSNLLSEAAGLPLSTYQSFLSTIQEEMPVIVATMYQDAEGNIYPINQTETVEDAFRKYAKVQYYQLFEEE